eukprot:jgi/Mesen1/9029/ME000565S08338
MGLLSGESNRRTISGEQGVTPITGAANFCKKPPLGSGLSPDLKPRKNSGNNLQEDPTSVLPPPQLLRSVSEGSHTFSILRRSYEEVREKYSLGGELGRGQFGIIRHCTDRKTGERLACKVISKRKLANNQQVEDVQREIRVMQQLGAHPYIVGLKHTYEDSQKVYLIMELCEGGELYNRITLRKRFSERNAAKVCKALAQAMQHMHSKGIMHRDLKPENIILCTRDSDTLIKVADYGLATSFRRGEWLTLTAGSAYYIAPEVLDGRYNAQADVWSVGVILYIMLCGLPPFWHAKEAKIFEAIRSGRYDLRGGPWRKISAGAKDLVSKLLHMNPDVRLTPLQLEAHPWITEMCTGSDPEDGDVPVAPVIGRSSSLSSCEQESYRAHGRSHRSSHGEASSSRDCHAASSEHLPKDAPRDSRDAARDARDTTREPREAREGSEALPHPHSQAALLSSGWDQGSQSNKWSASSHASSHTSRDSSLFSSMTTSPSSSSLPSPPPDSDDAPRLSAASSWQPRGRSREAQRVSDLDFMQVVAGRLDTFSASAAATARCEEAKSHGQSCDDTASQDDDCPIAEAIGSPRTFAATYKQSTKKPPSLLKQLLVPDESDDENLHEARKLMRSPRTIGVFKGDAESRTPKFGHHFLG